MNRILKYLSVFLLFCFCFTIASLHFSLRSLGEDGGEILFYFLSQKDLSIHIFSIFIKNFLNFSQNIDYNNTKWFHLLLLVVFFFSLQLHQVICLSGSYLALPKNKKSYIFFPFMGFLTGPFLNLGLLYTSAPAVFSMIWFLFFAIKYAQSSQQIVWIIFFVILYDISALVEHEMIFYMAIPIILMSLSRLKQEVSLLNKVLISITIIWIGFLTLNFLHFILLESKSSNDILHYKDFFQILFNWNFFININNGSIQWIYLPCIVAMLLLLFPLLQMISLKPVKRLIQTGFLTFIVLASIILLYNSFYGITSNDFFPLLKDPEAGVFLYISLPIGLLIWYLFEKATLSFKNQKKFLLLCLLVCFSFTVWNLSLDRQFLKYRSQFTKILSHCKGMVSIDQIKPLYHSVSKNIFHEECHLTNFSLILPLKYNIQTIIKNQEDCPYSLFNHHFTKTKYFNFNKAIEFSEKDESLCNF